MNVSASQYLDEILARVAGLPQPQRKELEALVEKATGHMKWVPNPGPQQEAYFSHADQLLYGGAAGGGKTQLVLALATQEHQRSLILRRINKEVDDLAEQAFEMVGHKDGYNGQKHRWSLPDGRLIQFGGCQHPGDERGYKGQAKDFIGIDEATEFLESQVDFLLGWLRTADQKQRTRLVLATNPAMTAEGEWVVRWFAPWVDENHALYPYPQGKMLWFERKGENFEFRDRPFDITLPNGRKVRALSRTFIKASLKDNPSYDRAGEYAAALAQQPEELRRRYEQGDFAIIGDDNEWQVIPTLWIRQSQQRWTARGRQPNGTPMTAMAVDVAQGGADHTVVAMRHDYWFAPMVVVPGSETPLPSDTASLIVKHRRDGAAVVVDVGGGYGGGVVDWLKSNSIGSVGFNGAMQGIGRTKDRSLGFANKRAQAWWQFREALDPDQPGGSAIELPDDATLRAELAAPRWKLAPAKGIQLEDKEETKKRIGRSPDRADAVVMCWTEGNAAIRRGLGGSGSTGIWSRPEVQGRTLPNRRRR